tara:strand:+ start:541 stop:699 length:159 start_codon:yes stop_codon:yes gene_type:complete
MSGIIKNNDFRIVQDYDTLTKLRWLQVNELAIKYPNDQEFGGKVRELVNNTK